MQEMRVLLFEDRTFFAERVGLRLTSQIVTLRLRRSRDLRYRVPFLAYGGVNVIHFEAETREKVAEVMSSISEQCRFFQELHD